ncbi:MAG: ribonuclease III [Verrucomicrobiales bacterium]
MESLEKIINYKFSNPLLLAEALTHPSLAYETNRPHFDNQRMEFLGDAVLQLVLTVELFARFPDFAEGAMTKLRSWLVSRDALQEYSRGIDLGKYLLVGKGEDVSGGRERAGALADAFESLVGAIYLDSGFEGARRFVLFCASAKMKRISAGPIEQNPKGELQEILQQLSSFPPAYFVVDASGPAHERVFVSVVKWGELTLGRGSGSSKKEAEVAAAGTALKEKLWED